MRNRFEVRGDTAVIFLPRHNIEPAECLIDTEDLPLVQLFSWSYADARGDGKHEYARATQTIPQGRGRKHNVVLMHRLVMQGNNPHQRFIDHLNHNGLDNRKANLRVCSATLNALNRANPDRGIAQQNGRWIAKIGYRGRRVQLGRFDSEFEAKLVLHGALRLAECLEQSKVS